MTNLHLIIEETLCKDRDIIHFVYEVCGLLPQTCSKQYWNTQVKATQSIKQETHILHLVHHQHHRNKASFKISYCQN